MGDDAGNRRIAGGGHSDMAVGAVSRARLFIRRYRKCRTGYPIPFSVSHALRHAWWEVTR